MSNVVKGLRNKIWITIVASFYGFILASLTIIYFLTNQQTRDQIYQQLYSVLLSSELYSTESFFSVDITIDGYVVDIHSDFHLTDSQYEKLIRLVLENNLERSTLFFHEHTWIYAVVPAGEFFYSESVDSRILFVDVTDIVTDQEKLTDILVTIALVSFLIIFASGFIIANRFVKATRDSYEKQAQITTNQKRFTSNAIHELKTPITLIKGSVDEILDNKDQSVKSQMEWFNMIEFGITRMENLTNELLMLARLENENNHVHSQQEFNISATINEILHVMKILAREKALIFSEDIQPDIYAYLNEEKFKQLLMIFLENAIKYADFQGQITVKASKEKDEITVSIHNTGLGIPAKDISFIFDRFYRSDLIKVEQGSGLGLPIAKEIVEQLGGSLTIESIVNEVTNVVVKFKNTNQGQS